MNFPRNLVDHKKLPTRGILALERSMETMPKPIKDIIVIAFIVFITIVLLNLLGVYDEYFTKLWGQTLGSTAELIVGIITLIIAIGMISMLMVWAEGPETAKLTVSQSHEPQGSNQKPQESTKPSTPKPQPRRQPDPKAFDRLIGLDEARQEIQDFFDISIMAIENPEKLRQYELVPPRGILLYGPPGTGKTAFARACAKYYGYPIKVVNASQIIAGCMYVGQTQERLRNLFGLMNKLAPAILFIDEIDAIASKRTGRSSNTPSE